MDPQRIDLPLERFQDDPRGLLRRYMIRQPKVIREPLKGIGQREFIFAIGGCFKLHFC